MVSIASVISAVSDDKAISLFKAVALSENDCSNILITKLKLSRRQYYSTMMRLMHANLVQRIGGRYRLTSLGRIIYNTYLKMETAVKYYWKLKAIDSILVSANKELPIEECRRIIDNMIDNDEIKAILDSDNFESERYVTSKQKKKEQSGYNKGHLKQLLTH